MATLFVLDLPSKRFGTTKCKLTYYSLDNKQQFGYFNYLPQDVWWFYIFIYLKLIDIINLLFISKSLNEVAGGYKQFKNHRNLARTLLVRIIIDKNKFNDLFMNQYDQLIIRLCGQFDFNTTLYLRYSPESLKRQFIFQMCWIIYSFVINLQILMRVVVGHVLDCLLMM